MFSNWYSNGTILSKIPFDVLEKKYHIIIITNQSVFSDSKKDFIKINLTNLSQNLSSNEIKNFNEYIEDYNKISNIEIKQVVSNHIFDRYGKIIKANSNEALSIESKSLETKIETGEILLLNADNFTSVQIRRSGISQQIIEITGDVQIKVNETFIRSEILNYNFSTGTLYARGDVLFKVGDIDVEVEKAVFDITKNKGILYGLKGTLITPLPPGVTLASGSSKMYYIASKATINDDEHLTLYDVEATYDSNKQPYVYMDFKKLDSFGEDKILIRNIVFKIHDHPLFYFPFFFQNPFGTGIEIKWGETDREGTFIENTLDLNIPVINKLEMELNFYQKIGVYLGFKNANTYDKNNYELHLALARTYVGNYFFPGTTLYNNFLSSLENEVIRYRYKVNYNHFFNLTPKNSEGKGVDTTLRYNFKKTGIAGQKFEQNDPFFTSELEIHHPRNLQFGDLLNLNSYNEPVFIPSASDTDDFYLTLNQSFPGSSLRIHSQWNYQVLRNTTSTSILDEDRYIQVLNSVNLPNINYSLSGTIDPIDRENERRNTFLNLNYGTSLNYNLLQEYQIEDYESIFNYNRNTLNINLSISRPFAWNENMKTKKKWKIFDMGYNPSLNVNYRKQWGASVLNDNTDIFNNNRENTYVDLKTAHSFSVHFPSGHQRQIFDNQLGFTPMIPKLDLHFNYNLDLREFTEEENEENDELFAYTARHGIGTSMRLSQNGYGLFMIPWLNYTQNFSSSFGYDLRPDLNDPYARLRDIDIQPLTDKFQPRVTQLIWDYRFNLKLELPKISFVPINFNYSVNFLVFDNNSKTLNEFRWDRETQTLIDKQKQRENFNLNFRFVQQKYNPLFFLKSLNLDLAYVRYGQVEQFNADNININFGFSLHFLRFFDIDISIGSYNDRVYLYEPKRVERYNEISSDSAEPVNFFEDVLASLGLKGKNNEERLANQRIALFKTSGLNINLNHDLDTWQLNASYSIVPTVINNTSSLRGFYFDQRFYLSITLKPQFDFFNLNENFKPWDVDLSPRELERLR